MNGNRSTGSFNITINTRDRTYTNSSGITQQYTPGKYYSNTNNAMNNYLQPVRPVFFSYQHYTTPTLLNPRKEQPSNHTISINNAEKKPYNLNIPRATQQYNSYIGREIDDIIPVVLKKPISKYSTSNETQKSLHEDDDNKSIIDQFNEFLDLPTPKNNQNHITKAQFQRKMESRLSQYAQR